MDTQDSHQEEQTQNSETVNGGTVSEGGLKDLGKGNEDKCVHISFSLISLSL